jgi:aminoglycoside phosphotransferase (APT) family kinase protein
MLKYLGLHRVPVSDGQAEVMDRNHRGETHERWGDKWEGVEIDRLWGRVTTLEQTRREAASSIMPVHMIFTRKETKSACV